MCFFSTKWSQEARLKERMVTCTSGNGIKNIRHMVDTSENPSVEPVDFGGILIFLQNGTFCDHQRYRMVDMNQCQVINVVLKSCLRKKHHSYNKSSSFGKEEVLAIVGESCLSCRRMVLVIGAWSRRMDFNENSDLSRPFFWKTRSSFCFPWSLNSRDVTKTTLRLFRLIQNVGFYVFLSRVIIVWTA